MSNISWYKFFMGVALMAAKRSKDPNTQVGACIVKDLKIVAVGYNGFPHVDQHIRNYSEIPEGAIISQDIMGNRVPKDNDSTYSWEREGDFLHTKYAYVCHAELNAILNKNNADLRGSTLFTTLFPCNECAKAIVQAGISHIVYLHDYYPDSDATKASKIILFHAGVDVRRFGNYSDLDEVQIKFN